MKRILYSPVGINQAIKVMFWAYLFITTVLCVITYASTKTSETETVNKIGSK